MQVSLVVCETDRLNAESARATSNWQRNRVAVVNLGDLWCGDGQVLGGGHAIIGGKGVAAAKVVIDGLAADGCDGEPVHRIPCRRNTSAYESTRRGFGVFS